MAHIKDMINELPMAVMRKQFADALERYGKEVAKNVRHKAAEMAVKDATAHQRIMNIQFDTVDSNPKQ